MAKLCTVPIFNLLTIFVFILAAMSMHGGAINEERKTYIVYMGSLRNEEYSTTSEHYSILENVLESSPVSDSLMRNYRKSFNGFAAKLNDKELQKLASMDAVVSVFPSRTYQLHTTRSWDFMGLTTTVKRQSTVESDVIVGVFDTGIWPESESFSDKEFGPPPKKWKGVCAGGRNFSCNNKIIGARYYNTNAREDDTARDTVGHGTHTASTAAGNLVQNASFYGLAQGLARGAVPSARIAVYKVCHGIGCSDEDILAAFDDAISDGVDIISISLGLGTLAGDLTTDAIAIGAFHAMEKGILTVNSAGNNGPQLSTVTSVAPWIFTVAASSTDRRIIDKVALGNGVTLNGTSVNSFTLRGTKFPLLRGRDMRTPGSKCDDLSARFCQAECFDKKLVNGKILLCDNYVGLNGAKKGGALGAIARKVTKTDVAFVVPFPASGLAPQDYEIVLSYYNSTKTPYANILKSESVEDFSAPKVASFSSRGPNLVIPEIVKPDVTAPGVNILAAFSPLASPSDRPNLDNRSVKYNFVSGTSMACPHVAGVAAYVKTFHPDWSPSAIKSALMTTAVPMKHSNDTTGIFDFGAGHMDPLKALHPGLVYEISKDDYINMMCSMGMKEQSLKLISKDFKECPNSNTTVPPKDLNYPTMASRVSKAVDYKVEFKRTVTNVGSANSTYKAKILSSPWINVIVQPSILSFRSLNEKQSYVVTVSGKDLKSLATASVMWSDGTHSVRSRVVVYNDLGQYDHQS